MKWNIATKEMVAIERVLASLSQEVRDARVDVRVDNQAVIHVWNNQGGRNKPLNDALKQLFFTVTRLNVLLRLAYVPTGENPADAPSRRLSHLDCAITPTVWKRIEKAFGGASGHTCDLMALDSNAMKDRGGKTLPHFTPHATPESLGINLFAQDLASHPEVMERPYVFPPRSLVGPVFQFLQTFSQSCTVVVLDEYPRSYWWPLLHRFAVSGRKVASVGSSGVLRIPTRHGWEECESLPADLWAFRISFG